MDYLKRGYIDEGSWKRITPLDRCPKCGSTKLYGCAFIMQCQDCSEILNCTHLKTKFDVPYKNKKTKKNINIIF